MMARYVKWEKTVSDGCFSLVLEVNLQLNRSLKLILDFWPVQSPTDFILLTTDRNILTENLPCKFLGSFLSQSPFCSLPPKPRVSTSQALWRKSWLVVVVKSLFHREEWHFCSASKPVTLKKTGPSHTLHGSSGEKFFTCIKEYIFIHSYCLKEYHDTLEF